MQEYLKEVYLTVQDPAVFYAVAGMIVLITLLLTGLYVVQNDTVRIYNWNGKRYCYLGRARLYGRKGGYYVRIGERIADLSYTTLYQICPSRRFVRRNRYENMMLSAGDERCMLHVDGCMRQSIYYRENVGKQAFSILL